jgi:hypothetical protein
VLHLVSFTVERVIYLALELDRSWTEPCGVNPLDGTNYLNTASDRYERARVDQRRAAVREEGAALRPVVPAKSRYT